MIPGKNLTIAAIMSIGGMVGSFTALAASSTETLNKTKDNAAVQRSQSDSATRNPALVNPNNPTGVNSNIPGASPVNPGGASPVNPSGVSPSSPSGVNPSNPAGTGTGSGY